MGKVATRPLVQPSTAENRMPMVHQMDEGNEGEATALWWNSFYELEPDYTKYYMIVLGKRAWNVGHILLCNNADGGDRRERGEKCSVDVGACMVWLDSKKANSVVYMVLGA
ncbi:scopoletin glucosyltransferase-like [Salvia hispanica]|uniref:scopoletin glucosyltransferase-like n=1 Tax=Salvia hispanica TaxID=49212 RepID=UPI002009DB1E|nr:scopoletin glucosyltransferase-like [Salvia hispanica]